MFRLPELTYSKTALEPFLSSETVEYHYGKHHKAYIDNVNRLIEGTNFKHSTLEDIVLLSDGTLFNNASQAWNHSFYWKCMCSEETAKRQTPSGLFLSKLGEAFGSLADFDKLFTEKVMGHFGSGWVWLMLDKDKKMNIISLPNAESPMHHGMIPLLVCDVWEHAYYIDYRNNRQRYVDGFLKVVDWGFVTSNYENNRIPNLTDSMRVSEKSDLSC